MNLVPTRGREGVQNPKNLEDVICTFPLTPLPPQCICTRPHGHLALLPEIALDRTTAAVYFVVQQWPASPFLV